MFDMPQGDPAALQAAAGRLRSVGDALRQAAGSVHSQASAVAGDWSGPASSHFDASAASVVDGLRRMAGDRDDAAAAIDTYARALAEAQQQAAAAVQGYDEASARYQATMASLAGAPVATAADRAALSSAEEGAGADLQAAYSAAASTCAHAAAEASRAAVACAHRLAAVAEHAKDTALHRFLDLLAGPGAALGTLGLTMQATEATRMWKLLRAFDAGDWATLAKADPKAYQQVLDVAATYGEDSGQAIAAQSRYIEAITGGRWSKLASAAVPLEGVPTEAVAGTLDVLGKAGLAVAVVGDIGTLVDGRASGVDKVVAGANLAGTGMAATDMVAETAVGAVLLGTDAVAGWIPGVGEVLVAGTAVYFAQEWVRSHWGDITHWASDAGRGVTAGVAELDHLQVEAAGDVLHAGEDVGRHVVAGAEAAGRDAVQAGEAVGRHLASGLEDAGSFVAGLL